MNKNSLSLRLKTRNSEIDLMSTGKSFHCLMARNAKLLDERESCRDKTKLWLLPRVLCVCASVISLKLGIRYEGANFCRTRALALESRAISWDTDPVAFSVVGPSVGPLVRNGRVVKWKNKRFRCFLCDCVVGGRGLVYDWGLETIF